MGSFTGGRDTAIIDRSPHPETKDANLTS